MADRAVDVQQPSLRKSTYFAYGYQEFAFGFMTTLGTMYFAFFMTDIVLIPAATVATIMLVARICDTVSVPVTGLIVQRSDFKGGKYSTWLFLATPIIIVFNMLMFSNLPIPIGFKSVLMSASYVLAYFFVNFCSTARFSIMPILTNDTHERTVLSSTRGQGSTLGQIIRGLVYVPLITLFGRITGSQGSGYFLTAIVFGFVGISGMYWIASIAKPFEKAAKLKEGARPSLKDMLKQLGTNRPLLILVLAETMRLGANQVLTSSNMYYFRYVLNNLMFMSIYMVVTFFGGFLGNSAAGLVTKKVDRKIAYVFGQLIWIFGMLLAYFLGAGNAIAFMLTITVAQFGIGLSNAGTVAFFSDTSDYGELKQGKNMRAVNMGLVIFPIKLGVLLGGTIQAFGLTVIHFTAGTTDPAVISGIHTLTTLLAAGIAALAILFMLAYPLTSKKMADIQEQLKAMHAKQA
jgi:GPH family glycoside/pentoside/hexuronide:cation symporter